MQLPPIDPRFEPKFKIGDTVWVIQGRDIFRKIDETNIRAIKLELLYRGEKEDPLLMYTGYRLGIAKYGTLDDSFSLDEIYGSRAEAQKLIKWHPVQHVSANDWLKAIGDRDNAESLDDSELGVCCANISDARDILLLCQENGGLIERDVQELIYLVNSCGYPKPGGKRPKVLDKIFGELKILSKVR